MLSNEQLEIDRITELFYGLFDNRNGRRVQISNFTDFLAPNLVIYKSTSTASEEMDWEHFWKPREKLLNAGTYFDFHEYEIKSTTNMAPNIAQRWSIYTKSWSANNAVMHGGGVKSFQFVKIENKWMLKHLVWDDLPADHTLLSQT